MWCGLFFCFKQKTAYEMRISDWSSDVCPSDLIHGAGIVDFPIGTVIVQLNFFPALEAFGRKFGGNRLCFVLSGAAVRIGRDCNHGRSQKSAGNLQGSERLHVDRKSVVEGKSVSVRVDFGVRRHIKKKKNY